MTQQIKIVILLIGLNMSLSTITIAQCVAFNKFLGTTSTDWSTASNWSINCVPSSPITDTITITANCTYTAPGNYIWDGSSILIIQSGVSFTNTSSGSWTMNGTVINQGSYIQSLLTNDGTQQGTGNHIGDLVLNGITMPGSSPLAWVCGEPLVYAGQSYATVQIGSQCWMAENLNVGAMITGSTYQTNNSIVEKYCYDNNVANCDTYGGLYIWNEMMQYSTVESSQGICPEGWHLPSDNEIKTLEIQLGMTQAQADGSGARGTDQGSQLAGNEPLWTNGLLDQNSAFGSSGFTGLPGGYRHPTGVFAVMSDTAYFWTSSTSGGNCRDRILSHLSAKVGRFLVPNNYGFSVRCVKN